VDYQSQGPVLITHWGLSGPGILKLSAWGAREFAASDYRFPIQINWLPGWNRERLTEWFAGQRRNNPKRRIRNSPPEPIPQRLWQRFTEHAGIDPHRCWTEFSRQERSALIAELTAAEFSVTGKSMFKEEFVTAGGVARDQVDFKTLESRVTPGLFFAGELLDVDGVTGGFNFQAAWTTGHLGGLAMAARLRG
jgi:hypothetical protein